jgi:riboflavin transporter FmnP
MKKITSREIAIAAALSALSATVQLIHVGYQSPQWGMWIDVVAVSWIIAYFLFGLRLSLLVSCVGALIITLFAPDTWLGASMKFIATVPIIFSFFLWRALRRKQLSAYGKLRELLIPLAVGVVVRCLIVLPLNYYYAIPIWTGMSPAIAMKAIPWFIIAGFNIVQSIVDVVLAWIIVYRFKLNRFARGTTE